MTIVVELSGRTCTRLGALPGSVKRQETAFLYSQSRQIRPQLETPALKYRVR